MRPRVKSGTFLARVPDGSLLLLGASGDAGVRLGGRSSYALARRVVPFLTGQKSVPELLHGLDATRAARVARLIEELDCAGVLEDASLELAHGLDPVTCARFAEVIAYLSRFTGSAAHRFEQYRESKPTVWGAGWPAVACAWALLSTGVRQPRLYLAGESFGSRERARRCIEAWCGGDAARVLQGQMCDADSEFWPTQDSRGLIVATSAEAHPEVQDAVAWFERRNLFVASVSWAETGKVVIRAGCGVGQRETRAEREATGPVASVVANHLCHRFLMSFAGLDAGGAVFVDLDTLRTGGDEEGVEWAAHEVSTFAEPTPCQYWEEALYSPEKRLLSGVAWQADAAKAKLATLAKFKVYGEEARIALPPPAVTCAEVEASGVAVDPAKSVWLSTHSYLAFGFTRHDPGDDASPYHRSAASARCNYPIELYWVLDSGVYYYDPMHHAVVRLRAGDCRQVVEQALGETQPGVRGFALLSANYWKSSHRYRNYAYRLYTVEAGLAAGGVVMAGEALGLRARLHHRFADALLDELLGLDPTREAVQLAVSLGRSDEAPRRLEVEPRVGGLGLGEVQAKPKLEPPASPFPILNAFNRDVRWSLERVLEELGSRSQWAPECGEPRRASASASPGVAELSRAVRFRESGALFLDFEDEAVAAGDFARIVDWLRGSESSDCPVPEGTQACDVHFVVRSVEGMAPGVYRLRRNGVGLVRAEGREVGAVGRIVERFAATGGVATVNFPSAPVVVYLSGPREWTERRYGARGLRMVSQVVGVVAHRICVAAGAARLVARIHNGYGARTAEAELGIAADESVLMQIAIGRSSTAAVLKVPVLF